MMIRQTRMPQEGETRYVVFSDGRVVVEGESVKSAEEAAQKGCPEAWAMRNYLLGMAEY